MGDDGVFGLAGAGGRTAGRNLGTIWALVSPLAGNAWVRSLTLLLVVYITIRAIAAVYGGDVQNSKLGPVAIRPHQNRSLGRKDLKLPKSMLPLNVDGVRATAEIYYVYSDSRGHRREQRIHSIPNVTVNVAPTPLPGVQAMNTGQEITDAIGLLHTEDVIIPTPDIDSASDKIAATPERVAAYVEERRVLEAWTEDDSATRISLHRDEIEVLAAGREEFIVEAAQKLRRARQGGFLDRMGVGRLARGRPSVIGSYYVKFRLSRSPIFILTRHPDRDLKMTAWLTVLTSLFAMLMEAWPLPDGKSAPTAASQAGPVAPMSKAVQP